MKFGGTSVENAAAMRNVSRLVVRHANRGPLVVASACAGVTNALLSLARNALAGGKGNAQEALEQLRARHHQIARDLFAGEILLTVQSQ
ncbi:MAG TPA: hypothetical protein VL126_05715, partial [Bacteroidota bacterium]|nr:hypothetical protein [Bacteroidota bacterium]